MKSNNTMVSLSPKVIYIVNCLLVLVVLALAAGLVWRWSVFAPDSKKQALTDAAREGLDISLAPVATQTQGVPISNILEKNLFAKDRTWQEEQEVAEEVEQEAVATDIRLYGIIKLAGEPLALMAAQDGKLAAFRRNDRMAQYKVSAIGERQVVLQDRGRSLVVKIFDFSTDDASSRRAAPQPKTTRERVIKNVSPPAAAAATKERKPTKPSQTPSRKKRQPRKPKGEPRQTPFGNMGG